jgi:hypothetical protein
MSSLRWENKQLQEKQTNKWFHDSHYNKANGGHQLDSNFTSLGLVNLHFQTVGYLCMIDA